MLISCLFPDRSSAQIVTNRVVPIADAYVRSDAVNLNLGTFTNLFVRTNAINGTATCHGYLKLDLTTVTNVYGASLRVYASMTYTGSVLLVAHSASDTNWTETAITWANRPATGSAVASNVVNVLDTSGRWYEFDISSFVKSELAAGRSLATLVLVEPTIFSGTAFNYAKVVSREFAINRPELAWTPIPTVSVTVDSSVINEGGSGTVLIFERKNAPLTQPLAVSFSIPEAYKIAGLVNALDLATRTVTIPAGVSSLSVPVSAVNDNHKTGDANGDKLLTVNLKPGPGSYLVDPQHASAQITIHDDDTAAPPSADQWPEIFNPWIVQRLDLEMPSTTWTALLNTSSSCAPEHYDATFVDGASTFGVKVWAKAGTRSANKITIRVDFNAVDDDVQWRGLQKLNLRADAPIAEGLARYIHRATAGTYGHEPGRVSFVQLYVNGVYNGVYANLETVDRKFVENRGFRRKNSTTIYQSNADCFESHRVYPNDGDHSPVYSVIGNAALQSATTWDKYFDLDAVLTQGAVDLYLGNTDGMFADNNTLRADFHYSTTLYPNGPPRTIKRSFTIPRDLDAVRFTGGPCKDVDMFSISDPRASQRHYEILHELTQGLLSATEVTSMINRLQFMLMESLETDTSITFNSPCGPALTLAQYFDDIRSFVPVRMTLLEDNIFQPELSGLPAKPTFQLTGNQLTIATTTADAEIWYTAVDARDPWALNTAASVNPDPNIPHFNSSSGNLTLPGTRHIVARARKNGKWSPLAQQTFVFPLSSGALQITEVNYRPDPAEGAEITAGYGRDDFEFLKLHNSTANPIDLSGHYFEGIVYRFPAGAQIPPNGDFILVRNPKAFAMRSSATYHGVYWDGQLDDLGETIVLRSPGGATVLSHSYVGLRALKFTEIHYRPEPSTPGGNDGEDFEFVEIQNTGAETLDISSLDISGGISLNFPSDTIIGPGNYLVIPGKRSTFSARYPSVPRLDEAFSGHLSDNGEAIYLNDDGETITSVSYGITLPWPTWAFGFGHSLVNQNLSGDPNSPSNWRASKLVHGSPGAADPAPPYANYTLQIASASQYDPDFAPVAALAIDEVGVAAGYGVHDGSEYAFMWDTVEGGGQTGRSYTSNPNCAPLYDPFTPFPWTSRGYSISDGLMVGQINYNGPTIPTAAIWQNGPTPVVGCGNGTPAYGRVTAYVANGYAGKLVGFTDASSGSPDGGTARRGDINGWQEVLGGFSGSTWNVANGVNLQGQAVGASVYPSNGRKYPLYWAVNGSAYSLALLSGATDGEALGINNNGWIVGYNILSTGVKRAVVWRSYLHPATDLGNISTGADSVATAINANGQIVGYSGYRACEWINGAVVDLNSRMPASSYTLVRAYGINDNRQVVGSTSWGTEGTPPPHLPPNHAANAWVLTPQ